jgi:hypothetical protein
MNPQNPTPTLPDLSGGSEYIVVCLNKEGLKGVFQIFVQEVYYSSPSYPMPELAILFIINLK